MLRLKTKKTHDKEASAKLPHGHDVYHYQVEQVFLGNHTIFTLLGLALGADLVARTAYDFLSQSTHPLIILSTGIVLFILSGMLLGSFKG